MNKSIEWIILITQNYASMKDFYTRILELPIERDIPEEEFTQFTMERSFLALYGKQFAQKLFDTPLTGKPGSAIYTFGNSNDIDSDYQQLTAKGVQFIKEPMTQAWGQRTAYFKDPDGNIWEIQQWVRSNEVTK